MDTRRKSSWPVLRYWWPILALVVVLGALVAIGLAIGSGVHEIASTAVRDFPGDRVEALMRLVESERHGLRVRNRAVWALGQIGDERALPLLERLHTGEDCRHSEALCQYELEKAIELCRNGRNLTAWVWRGADSSQRPRASPD